MVSDPEGEKTHCRLIPSYAGLANASTTMQQQQQSSRSVPTLNLASAQAQRGHAGKHPCFLAGQRASHAEPGVQSGPVRPQTSPMRAQSGHSGLASGPVGSMVGGSSSVGPASSPAQARWEGGAAPAQAYTARPATSGVAYDNCYGSGQAGFQPMSARAVHRPCTTGHYHASGATTWRGPYAYPLALGSSRYAPEQLLSGHLPSFDLVV